MQYFSIILPVYNRPNEVQELLESLVLQDYTKEYEVVVVEDGSQHSANKIVEKFNKKLNINYLTKPNTGPGDSRNFGMQKAKGNFFVILDSDTILPKTYLSNLEKIIKTNKLDAFGGVDDAHPTFTPIQKAINYAMTSLLTTGGLRNKSKNNDQLRSFNMGISKDVFIQTKGFSKYRYGEDIDLSNRIKEFGFKTRVLPTIKVYHKRRTNFEQFFRQTFNFGMARPILNKIHQKKLKFTYWFPTIFSFGFLFSIILLVIGNYYFISIFLFYFLLILIDSYKKNKNFKVALLSIYASIIQFMGYGIGFFRSWTRIYLQHKHLKETFPKMFS